MVGKDKNSNNCVFWDVVVITTADDAQKRVFKLQIESKKKRNELPLNLPIYVVADPPGPKIGKLLYWLYTQKEKYMVKSMITLLKIKCGTSAC